MNIQQPGAADYDAKSINEHNCMRRSMIGISALTMFLGFGIFIFGVVLYISSKEWIDGTTLLAILLALGFVIFIIAAVGFCGAYKRSSCWLCLYSVIVFILLAAKIAFVVVIILGEFKDDLEGFVQDRWGDFDNDSKLNVQKHFDCCGYPEFEQNPGTPCDPNITVGCKDEIDSWIKDFEMEIFIALGVVAFIELVMIVMGCCLMRTNRKMNKSGRGF